MAIRKDMRQSGQAPGYDGRCRYLTRDDVQQRKAAGQKYVIRFKVSMDADGVLTSSPRQKGTSSPLILSSEKLNP